MGDLWGDRYSYWPYPVFYWIYGIDLPCSNNILCGPEMNKKLSLNTDVIKLLNYYMSEATIKKAREVTKRNWEKYYANLEYAYSCYGFDMTKNIIDYIIKTEKHLSIHQFFKPEFMERIYKIINK